MKRLLLVTPSTMQLHAPLTTFIPVRHPPRQKKRSESSTKNANSEKGQEPTVTTKKKKKSLLKAKASQASNCKSKFTINKLLQQEGNQTEADNGGVSAERRVEISEEEVGAPRNSPLEALWLNAAFQSVLVTLLLYFSCDLSLM